MKGRNQMSFVRVERAKRNMSQEQLANKAGLNRYKIVRSENVDNILKDMPYDDIKKIATAFDMTLDEFVKSYEESGEFV